MCAGNALTWESIFNTELVVAQLQLKSFQIYNRSQRYLRPETVHFFHICVSLADTKFVPNSCCKFKCCHIYSCKLLIINIKYNFQNNWIPGYALAIGFFIEMIFYCIMGTQLDIHVCNLALFKLLKQQLNYASWLSTISIRTNDSATLSYNQNGTHTIWSHRNSCFSYWTWPKIVTNCGSDLLHHWACLQQRRYFLFIANFC